MSIELTKNRAWAIAVSDNLFFGIGGPVQSSEAEWQEYVERITNKMVAWPQPFVSLYGGAPNTSLSSTQRKYVSDVMKAKGIDTDRQRRAVVLTDSAILVGATTAIGWLANVSFKAFKPDDIDAALEWLRGGAPFDQAEAKVVWRKVRLELGYPPSG
jgi:hypothetical protein